MIKVSDRERTQEGIRAFIPPKLDLTTDAEYVANLLSVSCGCKRAAVKLVTWGTLYLHNDIFLTDII